MVSTYDERYQRLLLRLRDARVGCGLTQAHVAHVLGKPQSYISRCESGERRLDVIELTELAAVYHVSLDDLVRDER